MMTNIFQCHECQRPFLIDRASCCPDMQHGIINCGPLSEMRPNWKRRLQSWKIQPVDLVFETDWMTHYLQDSPVGKYLPGQIKKAKKKPYQLAMNWSGLQAGVVLDYGCCLAHGSAVIKDFAPEATYIGVDREPLFLALGATVYHPDFLYLSKVQDDRDQPLKHIVSASVDLLISSQITVYDNWKNISDEWLRLLQAKGFLYFETHIIKSADERQDSHPPENYVPDKPSRILIAEWLNRHFDMVEANCSLTDFVEGRLRLTGLYQRRE